MENTLKKNPEPSAAKQCSSCGATKPLAEFYIQANGKPRARCKVCLCAESRRRDPIYYQAHTEACKAKVRRWIENNRARFNESQLAAYHRRRDRGQTFLARDSTPPA